MGRPGGEPENKARGYKAAISNPNVSEPAKAKAKQELERYEAMSGGSDEEKPPGNVKRGLKAAMHNPNVTDYGKKQARDKLQQMGEEPEQPAD